MWPFHRGDTEDRSLTLEQLLAENTDPTWSGVTVNADQALRLSAVWACVRLLADTVSTLPVDVYRRGSRDPLPTPPLLQEPAAGTPRHEWLEAVMRCLLLRGNAYGLVTARSGSTLLPAQVELVNPDLVTCRLTQDGSVEYRIAGQPYDRDQIWHVRAHVTPGSPTGLSVVDYARQSIGVGLAAEKFGAQFFGDHATPSGFLSTTKTMSREQTDYLIRRWKSLHQGARRVALLTGDLKFTPVSIRPDESQFIETSGFNVRQVCRLFGVPPEMVGAESGGSLTYANVEQRNLDLLRYCVGPWLVRLETALSALLPRQQFVKFNPDALLRSDTKTRYEAHEIALRAGFLTIDEVRALEDLPPLGDAA